MKKLSLILVSAALLAACNSEDKYTKTRLTKIESVPEGAPIVMNGLNIGKTPLTVESETNEDGCFVRQTTITAIPQEPSLHTQVISFPAYNQTNVERSTVPEKIIFNMYKNPAENAKNGDGAQVER